MTQTAYGTTSSAPSRVAGLGFAMVLAPVAFALGFWLGWALCSLTLPH